MKAEELRIGNYVRGITDTKKRVTSVCIPELKYAHLFEGVPLTEEWLERFGFEWSIQHQGFNKEGFATAREHYINDSGKIKLDGYSLKGVIVKHIHQLQNLYFALTGEELTLTPSTA